MQISQSHMFCKTHQILTNGRKRSFLWSEKARLIRTRSRIQISQNFAQWVLSIVFYLHFCKNMHIVGIVRKCSISIFVYFKIDSEIAAKSYKQYLFVLSPTLHFLLVLQCSKFIIHQSKWRICHMTWPISWPTFKHSCFTLLFKSYNVLTPRWFKTGI